MSAEGKTEEDMGSTTRGYSPESKQMGCGLAGDIEQADQMG